MKEAGLEHWNSPNTGATNESGFTGLPAGFRDNYGGNYGGQMGNYGYFWSSSELISVNAWNRLLGYSYSSVSPGTNNKHYGFSVRCLYNLVWYVSVDGSDLNDGNQENPFTTIQHGIDVADEGQIVMVAPGTYHGAGNLNLNFDGKAITLISEAGADKTIIDCGGADRGFTFDSIEDSTSILDGFTITNGSRPEGGGIYCYYSSPTIKNCIITNNTAEDSGDDEYGGGGIYCYYSSPTIKNCIISNNSTSESGGGIYLDNSNPNITNSVIQNNYAFSLGGGIYIDNFSDVDIRNVNFIGNQCASTGAAISIRGQSNASFYYSLFANNYSNETAGVFYIWDAYVELNNVTMTNNSASAGAGAIFIDENCGSTNTILMVHNSIIYQNTAGGNGNNIYSSSSPCTDIFIKYSDVDLQNSYIGEGNLNIFSNSINEDPLFIDAENDDYNLQSNSPCIDTGSTDGNYYGDFEITDYNGSAPDMGAFEYVGYICPDLGDLNDNGEYNILDIVTLVNCVLAETCEDLPNGCAGDLNGDGNWNVLDVVILVNCVLADNCG